MEPINKSNGCSNGAVSLNNDNTNDIVRIQRVFGSHHNAKTSCPQCGDIDIGIWEEHYEVTYKNIIYKVQVNKCGGCSRIRNMAELRNILPTEVFEAAIGMSVPIE